MDPITFSSPNSYIPIYEWNEFPKFNSFSIEFQTTENYGVLAYILGADNTQNNDKTNKHNKITNQIQSKLLSFNRDFFSLEIHNRFLYAYFNLGSSYIRHEVVHEHVSSGKSHSISVEINDKYAIFRFDNKPETSIRIDSSNNDRLELSGPLIIGGIYPNHTAPLASNPSLRIPPYFYSGMLGHGYVGCIQDVQINGDYVNLTYYAELEGVSGVNTEMCTPMPNQCDIGHCMNDGVCMEGWNRFYCDCTATGFNGPICNQRKFWFPPKTLYVKILMILFFKLLQLQISKKVNIYISNLILNGLVKLNIYL
jgi:neurexin